MRSLGKVVLHPFSGLILDRCEQERKTSGFVEQQLYRSPSTSVMVFDEEFVLVAKSASSCLLPVQEVLPLLPTVGPASPSNIILLGRTTSPREGAVAAVAYWNASKNPSQQSTLLERGWEWIAVRKFLTMGTLEPNIAPLVGLGKSLAAWHATHPYCSRCGALTKNGDGGTSRSCESCKTQVYPRINPCAIMLVLDGQGRCLLGKGKGRPFYTTLAGFCSHGECIEETVCREVLEESGVGVREVYYHSSQSWPFPFQLMLGFHAHADPNRLSIQADPHEMDDVMWVGKDDVRRALQNDHPTLTVPPALSISHQLMRAWVDGAVTDCGAPAALSSL